MNAPVWTAVPIELAYAFSKRIRAVNLSFSRASVKIKSSDGKAEGIDRRCRARQDSFPAGR